MDLLDEMHIDRALEELRLERRRLFDRIRQLIEASPREAEILGYLRGTENTSEAMLSLAKSHYAQTGQRTDRSRNR